MKKNTRLLAVLLALTILALSLTACSSSSKYVAETTTATVSNSRRCFQDHLLGRPIRPDDRL